MKTGCVIGVKMSFSRKVLVKQKKQEKIMDIWVKRGLLVLGALVALYLIVNYVLPLLFKALGILALIIGWVILIGAIIFAIWFFIQKFR